MKVKLDDEVIFEIDETMMKLLAHDLEDPISEIKRRLKYIIEHKCEQSFKRMEASYMDELRLDPSTPYIPKDQSSFVDAIIALPSYADRNKRNLGEE